MLKTSLLKKARLTLLILLIGLLAACNLTNQEEILPTNTPRPNVNTKPSVTITAPQDGSQSQVDSEILVTASATDEVGVTRVQLLANGQVVRAVNSENPLGEKQKNVALGYTPRVAGEVNLSVVAYRGQTVSDPAQITVRVVSQVVATSTPLPGGGPGPSIPTIDPNDPTCRARARTELNMRQGPNTTFPVLRVLAAGEVLPIIGRLGDNSWWQLRSGTTVGWVSASFTDPFGSLCSSVPIVQPPTTATPQVFPTLTPTFTLAPTNTFVPTVTNTPGPADLIPTAINGPRNVNIPSGSTSIKQIYSLTLANNGSRRSGEFDFEVKITNLTTNESKTLTQPPVSNLRAGEAISLDFEVEFTSAGSYTIDVEVDTFDDVQEVSEANNTAFLRVSVVQQ